MKILLCVLIVSYFSLGNGQRCQGRFNATISGQCSAPDDCQGTVLPISTCEDRRCCINEAGRSPNNCLKPADFDVLYNTSRATFLRTVLSYGINSAGICANCQAKAAFLAIAATMTEDFQTDEAAGNDAQFAADDAKYGNNQTGDGSRFRRRGFFGLRGREMYGRLQNLRPQYAVLSNPELAALTRNSIEIATLLWRNPTLQNGSPLTQYADGTFYSFSLLWYTLTGGIELLAEGAQQYSKFLRQLECGGDLYPGQGQTCQYNATHQGTCSPDCIRGLEDSEYCGCSGGKGDQCPNSPPHIRCCLDTCTQELKMDLGFVLDASGSIQIQNYKLQLNFTKELLRRVNVGENKTHVGIINYSSKIETLTWLDNNYDLQDKLRAVDQATYFDSGTYTAGALQQANAVFSLARGFRPAEQGATPVIFVITDGQSNDTRATIRAATVLKDKGINLISVGVGSQLDLNELKSIATPPASENYFAIANYGALNQKLNQFTSKSCSEPTTIPANITVTGEVSKDKYKFLKIQIVFIGNKILITVKLFNGKVNLFYSFTSRNPKDPKDFANYQEKAQDPAVLKNAKAASDEVTLVLDKPDEDVEFVYVGVKGLENDNKFEVKVDDCANVICSSQVPLSPMKFSVLLLIVCITYFFF